MIDPKFLSVLRAVLYLILIFLIVFDLPTITNHYHRILLVALLAWLGVLFISAIVLLLGFDSTYLDIRDYGSTTALTLVVLAHIYWLNHRNK